MKRIKTVWIILAVALLICSQQKPAQAQTELSTIVDVRNTRSTYLVGYGLVTGLNHTGDRATGRRGAAFTVQSIANMLNRFGINVNPTYLRTRNVAAVMVTADLSAYRSSGSTIDVTVSSLGNARSLRGGVLLQTPLINPQTDKVYAYAQGPLVVGGVGVRQAGASFSRNKSLTATIPNGGSVIQNQMYIPNPGQPLGLILQEPNYTNAKRIVEAINEKFGDELASATNAGYVSVNWPNGLEAPGDMTFFTSKVMDLAIKVDTPARVVINERTGTIVAGGDVKIGNVLVSHGTVQIRTQTTPFVSQPPPFSGGSTVAGVVNEVGLKENAAKNMVIPANTSVADLAESLNNLGFSPRDIISIFMAIEKAGALKGKLIVM